MPEVFIKFDSYEEYEELIALRDSKDTNREDDEALKAMHAARSIAEEISKRDELGPLGALSDTSEELATFEGVKRAITNLSGAKGIDAVKKIFSDHNVRNAKELSEDEYGRFIRDCEAA